MVISFQIRRWFVIRFPRELEIHDYYNTIFGAAMQRFWRETSVLRISSKYPIFRHFSIHDYKILLQLTLAYCVLQFLQLLLHPYIAAGNGAQEISFRFSTQISSIRGLS